MSRGESEAPKAKHKRTENPNQIYITAAMVLVGALVFGLVLLPRFDPSKNPLVSESAPDFALEVIHEGEEGSRIRLSNLRGKPVLLDFWASWCGPCRTQAPIVDQIAREYADQIHVIGVDTGDAREPAQVFAKQAKLTYPCVFDPDGATAKGYNVSTLPTLVLIDKDGTVRMVRSSVMQRDALKAALEPLLE